jgi:hypothetical protein
LFFSGFTRSAITVLRGSGALMIGVRAGRSSG